jgi:acyl-CoA hydrolase
MDINPFIVGEVGSESVAADARITLQERAPRMTIRMASFDPDWQTKYRDQIATAEEAVARASGPASASSSAPAAPSRCELVRALTARARPADTEIVHLLTFGDAPYATRELSQYFRVNSFFIAENVRGIIQEGLGDYTPIFLSDIPRLFNSGQLPLDVALIQVTPPDANGMCSLGVSVDIVKSAAENARARHRPGQPQDAAHAGRQLHPRARHRRAGARRRRPRRVDSLAGRDPDEDHPPDRRVRRRAGRRRLHVEFGIGRIPQAVVEFLKGQEGPRHPHRDVHRLDDRPDRVRRVVTGRRKTSTAARSWPASAWAPAALRLHRQQPAFAFHPTEYVNDPFVISRRTKQVAINVALEVDLTGQVCADSLGTSSTPASAGRWTSTAAPARSPGGKAIIALPSTAKDGTSRAS